MKIEDTTGVGDRIRILRKEKHQKQQLLAYKIGMNQQMISNIECGLRRVYDEEICRFADYFEVSADYLLGRINTDYRCRKEFEICQIYNEKHDRIIQIDFDRSQTQMGHVCKECCDVMLGYLNGTENEREVLQCLTKIYLNQYVWSSNK